MTVLAVLPGKAPERMELDDSLESMQRFVGGSIAAVSPFPDRVAIVCADEGKFMGLEYTQALRDENGNVYDILCGPFFICGLGDENFASLPEELIPKYTQLFQHPELFLRVGNQLMVVPF